MLERDLTTHEIRKFCPGWADHVDRNPGEPLSEPVLHFLEKMINQAREDAGEGLVELCKRSDVDDELEKQETRKEAAMSAQEKLNKMAEAHATAKNMPIHKAYDEVLKTDEGKQLYSQDLEEQKARVAKGTTTRAETRKLEISKHSATAQYQRLVDDWAKANKCSRFRGRRRRP